MIVWCAVAGACLGFGRLPAEPAQKGARFVRRRSSSVHRDNNPIMAALETIFVLLLVLANGFFVAAEFSLVKVRLSQIEQLAQQGQWAAKITQRVLGRLDAYLSACQLGITLASLGLGWVGENMAQSVVQPAVEALGLAPEKTRFIAFPLAFVCITILHITLGEQAPKILAIRTARTTSLTVGLPLVVFCNVLWPLIWLLNMASNLLVRALGVRLPPAGEQTHTADELRLILAESAAGGELSRRERLMMENVLDLEDKVVRQVMVPRRDIVYLSTRRPLAENMKIVSESRHTRFPLCDGDLDRVIGMVHSKDLLNAVMSGQQPPPLTRLTRKLPFLPETMRLNVLLREFQRNRTHVAMVVDEYGTVSGMVTFENVLEELVGPIQDEFDRELPQIIRRGCGRFLVDAMCPLDDLLEQCHVEIPEITADTTGGLMVELLGHIPQVGEKIRLGHHELTVLDAEPTRVRRVEVVEIDRRTGEPRDAAPREAGDASEPESESANPTERSAL